jgi:SNF2 family DNA or RNA helicase
MGNQEARDIIERYEFYFTNRRGPKFDVVVTSYDLLSRYLNIFTKFNYIVVIVEESSHVGLSHSDSENPLSKLSSEFRLLLNSTPLTNTVHELQSVLAFVHSGVPLGVTRTRGDFGNMQEIHAVSGKAAGMGTEFSFATQINRETRCTPERSKPRSRGRPGRMNRVNSIEMSLSG